MYVRPGTRGPSDRVFSNPARPVFLAEFSRVAAATPSYKQVNLRTDPAEACQCWAHRHWCGMRPVCLRNFGMITYQPLPELCLVKFVLYDG